MFLSALNVQYITYKFKITNDCLLNVCLTSIAKHDKYITKMLNYNFTQFLNTTIQSLTLTMERRIVSLKENVENLSRIKLKQKALY